MRALVLAAAASLLAGVPASAQAPAAIDTFAVYQSCFDKAATDLFAAGVTQAAKLEKAARKRCKQEREAAIIDEQVRFMSDPRLMATFTRNDMIRALDGVVARPVMKRLGFEGY